MTRPVIGITTWRKAIPTQLGDARPAHTLGVEYADAIQRAGGVPVLLPPHTGADDVLSRLDGLLLSGGEDMDPSNYGAASEGGMQYSADRDAFEIELVRGAQSLALPTLAICRGLQVTNVALGGTLIVDIPSTDSHAAVVVGEEQLVRRHDVVLTEGSRLETAYGTKNLTVNTIHHQAIDRIADDLVVTGVSDDGIVEAVESQNPSWAFLGVQWHPEKMTGSDEQLREDQLFSAFIELIHHQRL
ncbi:MAG: gamma-glutamyl-gamma-aminobutyrate hydrolase family protein [Leucobacter sp.]